jgi:hypothetical protein
MASIMTKIDPIETFSVLIDVLRFNLSHYKHSDIEKNRVQVVQLPVIFTTH